MRLLNFAFVWIFVSSVSGVPRNFLYEYGRGVPDKQLPPQDDISSPELFLRTPITFFDEVYHSIYINSNGILSFITELPAFFNIQFPLDYPVIAPLYTNVDVRASGSVYYRESQEEGILQRATTTVRKAFDSARNFEAKSALIVTWEDVGYHKQGADKVNTFQVITISNEQDTYVEFIYPENGIQWIKGTSQSTGLPDALAQAGIISVDGRMYTLKGSGTDQVLNLKQWSNVGNPGQWLFHVGRLEPETNVNLPDMAFSEVDEPPKTCSRGVFYCHSKATCDDYSTGFCCACQPGYYGNGINCMSEEIPVRVIGKVSGTLNGITLADSDLQAYIVPKDGRSYTALSKILPNVGHDMQSLNVFGSSIGWLFAKPVEGTPNGYQITGGVFNQTITVTYPQTGHQVILRQKFTGLDVFQQLTMSAEIKGDVPSIANGSKIGIKDYVEQYTRIGPGQLIARSSQVFQLEGVDIDNAYNVDQVIQYTECQHSSVTLPSFRVKVARNFIRYETENIIRYAMSNTVTPIGVDEDPCKKGKNHCQRHSTCVPEGDSFRCVCTPGYQTALVGDGVQSCVDIDECSDGTHNCDYDAYCLNNQGSFYCQCHPGFSGDGYTCTKDITCQDIRCHYDADCVQRSKNAPQCFCKPGYTGNGTHCAPSGQSRPEDNLTEPVPTRGHSSRQDYEVAPHCFDSICYCSDGYQLDETLRKCIRRTEQEAGIPCNVLNRCHPHAQCVLIDGNGNHVCECNQGYQGDGIECSAQMEETDHYPDDECLSSEECVGEADCVLNQTQGISRYVCVCHQGFVKDPISRTCVDENLDDTQSCRAASDCHERAECVTHPETGETFCECSYGFVGDGRHDCRPADGRTDVACNVFNNCAVGRAECSYVQGSGYRCRCNPGFEGDGITCNPIRNCLSDPSLCPEHSSCLPSQFGDYNCQCHPGFIWNGQYCRQVTDDGNFLLLNQGNAMLKIPYRPTSNDPGRPIIIQYSQQSIGIDVDCANKRVFWSDIAGKKIESATYRGSEVKPFITTDIGSVEGLSVDWLSRNIYWTDSTKDTIEVANLENSKLRKVLVSTRLVNPRGIAIHPSRGKIFWSDWDRAAPKIEWANMDGTERSVFLQGPSVQLPNSLAIDFSTDELCWADAGTKTIECIGIGNRYDRTVARNCTYPFGLAISQDHYYWTDWTTRKIERVTRPGQVREKPLNVPLVGSPKLYGIAAVSDSCPRQSNICQHSRACPENHLCLPDGKGGRACICASDQC